MCDHPNVDLMRWVLTPSLQSDQVRNQLWWCTRCGAICVQYGPLGVDSVFTSPDPINPPEELK